MAEGTKGTRLMALTLACAAMLSVAVAEAANELFVANANNHSDYESGR